MHNGQYVILHPEMQLGEALWSLCLWRCLSAVFWNPLGIPKNTDWQSADCVSQFVRGTFTDVKQGRFGAQTVLLTSESLIYVRDAPSRKYFGEPTALLPLSPLVGEHVLFFFLHASTSIKISIWPSLHCEQTWVFLGFFCSKQ